MTEQQPTRWSPNPLEDILDALLWPRLLRVPALAARPQRVLLCLFLVTICGLIGGLRMPWHEADKPPLLDDLLPSLANALHQLWTGVTALHAATIERALLALAQDVPARLLEHYPLTAPLLGIPIAIVASVLGGAVARSVACEFCQEITHPWPRQLGFAVARWRMLFGAVAIPALVVGLVALLLAAAGILLFNAIPALELAGALLYGLALLLGLVAVTVTVLTALGWPMLVPAVACEGTDAIDAVQRVFAYVVARPLRFLAYLLIATAVGALAVAVVGAIASAADAFTQAALQAWTGPQGAAEITGAYPPGAPLNPDATPREPGPLASLAADVVSLWGSLLALLVAAYAASNVITAGTLIYLFMRETCDGQHHNDLWTPAP